MVCLQNAFKEWTRTKAANQIELEQVKIPPTACQKDLHMAGIPLMAFLNNRPMALLGSLLTTTLSNQPTVFQRSLHTACPTTKHLW